ncbi:hypothetical protein KP781_04460 [Streptococcus equi subsp. zooepidemicus]|nr:hypothetical protein [Streptococcus equi]MCD3398971.1 hypothetical protein [Streptococcus equi subsp. zooepidemicus]MCD3451541.1 hypothetical protein [Streptococcus equi subsp. zooepidemicus]MCD3465907.1 hypothetical protein [Streptococcus equi subsp. zooepidemicus]HEL1013319.1 hypothetical protein [Streptococcus equi subsp. zooepidemicus]HEL1015067.1 hypothetical protein [Streptococcus equi subsp. zooepidemicus]
MTNDEYFNEIENYFKKLKYYKEKSKTIVAGIMDENSTEVDMFFISALNRRVQFMDGIIELLKTRNLTCAGILVRTQLDNLMRVFAAFISDDRRKFIQASLNGKGIRNMKDNQNKKMTDFYLKKRISEYYPEIEEIYNKSSGYVHLSEVAFHQAFWIDKSDGKDSFRFSVGLSPREELNPVLIECAEVFCHFTEIEYDFYQKIIDSKKIFDQREKNIDKYNK